MKLSIAMIAIILMFSFSSKAQRVESGTGYWYDGVVTHQGNTAKVASNEPRPLRQAVESLSEEYGWIIDYEDPIYSDVETIDRTEPLWVASHPGIRQRLVGGHKFQSQFPEAPKVGASTTEKAAVLQKIVADFNQSGNPGQFTLVDEGAGRFAVIGQGNGAQAILDAPISVNIDQLNGSFALKAISQALTNSSGTKIIVATYPLNLFVQTIFTSHASNLPARDVLRSLADATQRKVAWQLLYDIDDKAYYLNLKTIR